MALARRFALTFTALLSCVRCLPAAQEPAIDFDRDIRPIFSDNCYQCHGPDERARKAKLRLDTKEGAFRVLDSQTVIQPGKSGSSELIRRVTTTDADDHMPPAKTN